MWLLLKKRQETLMPKSEFETRKTSALLADHKKKRVNL